MGVFQVFWIVKMVPNSAKRLIYGGFPVLFYTRLNTKYCTAVLPITQLEFILADILVYFSFAKCFTKYHNISVINCFTNSFSYATTGCVLLKCCS